MKFIKGLTVLILLLTIVLITSYYILFRTPGAVYQAPEQGAEQEKATGEVSPAPVPELPHRRQGSQESRKTITIIIDDIGFALAPVEKLLRIDAPLAFAILPYSPHADEAAEMIHGQKREILLHLPMEPRDRKHNSGPGALLCSMTASDIKKQVDEDLAVVPHAAGVNNHMGSAFMEDEEKLSVVLKELQKKGLFFIDSRTTAASRGKESARKTGIRFAGRGLFLDSDRQAQELIVKSLLEHREKQSSLVIIGHPYPDTVAALQEAIPLLQSRGIRIVSPSELVEVVGER